MYINGEFFITKNRAGVISSNLVSGYDVDYIESDSNYKALENICYICRRRSITKEKKNTALISSLVHLNPDFTETQIKRRLYKVNIDTSNDTNNIITVDKEELERGVSKLISFFSEFHFTPSFRFVNALALAKNATNYVKNYFSVQGHQYATEISEKINSPEFSDICTILKKAKPTTINTRFELYFGEPGTGKTTNAMKATNICMVCSSDMLPSDLLQNFDFDDGKATFEKSDLWNAIENGNKIVLDEINMLPFESLRFLQGITDGKKSFDFKGHKIKIHDNFKIIGTMNLNVNGQCIPLPAPLVDRCSDIKEFVLNADALVKALIA